MGGRPLTALSIAAFPEKDFPFEWAAAIVEGGASKLGEAGCALLGGHSVRDPEIKFGYAITGLVDPASMMTNAGARPGDVLVLTKPLGTGILATALKAGQAGDREITAAAQWMANLNAASADAARRHGVRAATDVTGFGLLGHASNLARESGVSLLVRAGDLPVLEGAEERALRFQAGGLKANRRQFEPLVEWRSRPTPEREALLFDPQTSGGLLLAVPEPQASAFLAERREARTIGEVRARSAALLLVS
jgi:selenide,water dikinase